MSAETEAVALLSAVQEAIESNARPAHWLRIYSGLESHLMGLDGDLFAQYRSKRRHHQQRVAHMASL